MKKIKAITIDDKKIQVNEMAINEILFLGSLIGVCSVEPEFDLTEKVDKDKSVYEIALSFATDITIKEITIFSPSEIEKIYNTFSEVNETAFNLIKYIGLEKAFEELKGEIVNSFIKEFASSFSEGVAGLKLPSSNVPSKVNRGDDAKPEPTTADDKE